MRQFAHKLRGLSLFEILLVLVITSIIAVATLKYVQNSRETAADKLYGMNLYTFGQAVNQYISNANLSSTNPSLPGPAAGNKNAAYAGSPASITTATVAGNLQITAVGVDWLKKANAGLNPGGSAYLPDTFSFVTGMSPLVVALPDPSTGAASTIGDAALTTVITIMPTGVQIKIVAPALFEAAEPGIDPGTHQPYAPVLRPSLTEDGIQRANTFYNANGGIPAIQYTYPYINTTTGAVTAGAQVTGKPSTAPMDKYLRRDGGNTMLGTLAFDATATSKLITGANTVTLTGAGSQINKLDSLQFNAISPSSGSISGLNALNMSPQVNTPSTIQGLNQIQFQTAASSPSGVGSSVIANLAVLNFDTTSPGVKSRINFLKTLSFSGQSWNGNGVGDGIYSQITELDEIYFNKFGGDIVFRGISFRAGAGSYYSGTKPSSGLTDSSEICVNSTSNPHAVALPANAFCYINHLEFKDDNSGHVRKCYIDNGAHTLTGDNAGGCCAQCFAYQ